MIKKGTLFTFLTYLAWGFFPLYFKAIKSVPAFDIVAHRILWSFVFMTALLLIRKKLKSLLRKLDWHTGLIYLVAGILLTINWGTYVYAVNSDHIVEASLGYFINPLVSVLLGTVFLREKLRPTQWVSIGLTAIGVIYLTAVYGSFPWISISLAISFGLYGYVKKTASLEPQEGLFLETATLALPAVLFLVIREVQGTGSFLQADLTTKTLLLFCGVITAVPLIFFATGAKEIPLVTIGLLQYITPTLQFLVGVLLYSEPFTRTNAIGFAIIWLSLIIFSIESLVHYRQTRPGMASTEGSLSIGR